MATIVPVVTVVNEHTVKFFWETLTTTDDAGTPIVEKYMDYADRSVQVTGTFGAGGNLRIGGSNDGSNFPALNDLFGNALNITAASTKGIAELPLATKPIVTGGDGTTDLDVTIVCRKTRSAKGV